MGGEKNLETLLATMRPVLGPDEVVICTVDPSRMGERLLTTAERSIGWFREDRGLTLFLDRSIADELALEYHYVARVITLEVHSSLDAVGFLAAITARLAAAGISVNPVSAYYHDHLLVPAARADEALALLLAMSRSAAGAPPQNE